MKHILMISCLLFSCASDNTINSIDKRFKYKTSDNLKTDTSLPSEIKSLFFAINGNQNESYSTFQLGYDTIRMMGLPLRYSESFLEKFDWLNAIDYISKTAKKFNVTLINEAHNDPKHRAFTESLLTSMKDSGYTHLALEGITYDSIIEKSINSNAPITFDFGFYLIDPGYSNLIKKARNLGYEIISYDKMGKKREVTGAKNILNKLGHDDKVLIHCGYDHINEDTTNKSLRIAAEIKNILKEDVFTINQTFFNEYSRSNINDNLNHYLDSIAEPTIFYSFKIYTYESKYDEYVFHPKTRKRAQRAEWKHGLGYKVIDYTAKDKLVLVYDTLLNEDNDFYDLVPFDIFESRTDSSFNLFLNPQKTNHTIIEVDNMGEISKINKMNL